MGTFDCAVSIVDADVYLNTFGSDRSHMLNPLTRQWNAKPPSYPCILPCNESNLVHYMTIDADDVEWRTSSSVGDTHPFGVILSLSEFKQRFLHIDS